MMAEEYRKYDTEDSFILHNVRLTADATDIGEELAKLTVVSTSRNDKDADIWIDIVVGGGNYDYASRLQKGDIISATGKLTMHRFGADDDKVGFQLRMPRLHYSIPLLQELGERGGKKAKGAKGKADKSRRRREEPREVVDLDDDE